MISTAAGWSWGALLLSMFISTTALSKLDGRRKAITVEPIVAKGSERDAGQVLANAGVYSAAALGYLLWPSSLWPAIGAGALAASASDTWATELGILAGDPRSIISGKIVPPGTSGGITALGTAAGLAGGVFIGAAAALATRPV